MSAILALVLCFASASYAGHLTYTDCNHSPDKVIHFDHAQLSPDPVHIPGPETGSIDVHVLRPIAGNHFKLNLKIQKKASIFSYITIPCIISPVGSCSYELCDLLSGEHFNGVHHCPLQIQQSSPDFNCACPFQPGDYHLNKTTFVLPKLSGLWGWLAEGDYHVHATLTDTANSHEVGCYDIHISTETMCSGFGCIFG